MSSVDKDVISFIRQCAVENAVKYEGKANPKALIGRVIGKHPDLKNSMNDVVSQIQAVVDTVNSMSLSEQQKELLTYGIVEKKTAPKSELKELEGARAGNVVMRFAPAPSGPAHIGHAITGGLTSLYIKKYGGKFILRLEDTDSDKTEPEAYKWLFDDLSWVFGNISEVVIQSDRMELYYSYAWKMIEAGFLYVCTCTTESFKEFVTQRVECPCRSLSVPSHSERYNKMFDLKNGFKEGGAVIRFKGNMQHDNPAMRDFPLMRINDTNHPRQGLKYRVWPLMNFSVFVDDVEMGMTHVIRAKEHYDNAKRQELMYAALGKTPPHTYFTGRYNIEGLEISKTRTKEKIRLGEYTGWQDIRLAFIQPLRRRGYQPGAFLTYAKNVGLSATDKTISIEDFYKTLDAYNKDIIDPIAHRFFFIGHPVKISVPNLSRSVTLALHPEHKSAGGRPFAVSGDILIEANDLAQFSADTFVRLMDLCNVKRSGEGWMHVSDDYEAFKMHSGDKRIIHWLPDDASQLTDVQILMPTGVLVSGKGEANIRSCKVNDVVQFERFGFCRLDSVENGVYIFWYAHR